jgi:hypothetical protein
MHLCFIQTAPSILFWMCAYPLRREVGWGWVWNSRVFWALRNGIVPIGECHLGPKNSSTGLYKSTVHRLFYAYKPPGDYTGCIVRRSRVHSVGVEEQVNKGTKSPCSGSSGALRNEPPPPPPLQNLLEMKRKL